MPCEWKTTAAVNNMKNATAFETAMPNHVSVSMRLSCSSLCSGANLSGISPGSSLCSSTSSDACQKNRYGLIGVPKIATTVMSIVGVQSMEGTNVARATSFHGISTTNATPTYPNSARQSHFSSGTYRWYGTNTSRIALPAPTATI